MKEETQAPAKDPSGEPLESLKARLLECVRDLDRLEMHHPAALICMAIDRLEQRSDDRASFG